MANNVKSRKTVSRAGPPQEATAMLRADHKTVSALFAQYEGARSMLKKKALVSRICNELRVHTQIEEEIFCPAAVGTRTRCKATPLAHGYDGVSWRANSAHPYPPLA